MLFLALATAVTWQDVQPEIRPAFSRQGAAFDAWVKSVAAENERRVAEGEADHLVHYVLQSRSFTALPLIEPALSAKEHRALGRVPAAVSARIRDFLASKASNPRLDYFRRLAAGRQDWIAAEYQRTMRFLWEKEWGHRERSGAGRREAVAALYRTRGHSTDTSLDAAFGVETGIGVLSEQGARVRRVLVIGPGLDMAPRTGLREDAPPQSVQPYALLDSLLRTGVARADDVEIVCADINSRVVDWIAGFERTPQLRLEWSLSEPEHARFLDRLGRAIGERTGPLLRVRPEMARRIRSEKLDAVTERLPEKRYDLAVATNVLLYFGNEELALAMSNIARALAPGGYFLHNEDRREIGEFGMALDLPLAHARMVRLSAERRLHDPVAIHAKPK